MWPRSNCWPGFFFSTHAKKAATSASSSLGLIKRTISSHSPKILSLSYKRLVWPRLETGMVLESPFFKKDVKILEDVQRRATMMVSGLRNSLTLQGYASWNSQLWFTEEDRVMPFWFISLLIQRHLLISFLWRLRTLIQRDITFSFPGISPQSGNAPIFWPTVLPTFGTNYCQIPLLPKPQTALRTVSTTNGQQKNGSITGKHSNQQHQTTSQIYIFNYMSCIINSGVSTRKNP